MGFVRVQAPRRPGAGPHPAVVAIHGYGQPPATLLAFAVDAAPDDRVVIGPEGPSTFYRRPGRSDGASKGGIGHGWVADPDRDATDRRNDTLILAALDEAENRHRLDPARTFLLAYSQGVGVATHVFATHPERFAGLVGIAGGVPKAFRPRLAVLRGKPVLWISGSRDSAYPVEYTDAVVAAWREAGASIETRVLDQGHDLLPHVGGIVGAWLRDR